MLRNEHATLKKNHLKMIFVKNQSFFPNFVHLLNDMISFVIGVGFKVDAEKYITRFRFGINYNVIFSLQVRTCLRF